MKACGYIAWWSKASLLSLKRRKTAPCVGCTANELFKTVE